MSVLTFKAGNVNVTIGQRWIFRFINTDVRMIVEIIGKGNRRDSYSYSDSYIPVVKVLQINRDGKDIESYSTWHLGTDNGWSPSIGIGDRGWSLLDGQEAPNG